MDQGRSSASGEFYVIGLSLLCPKQYLCTTKNILLRKVITIYWDPIKIMAASGKLQWDHGGGLTLMFAHTGY
jgi:hypothetical protein